MPRKVGDECTFRQRDLKAAIRAARDAGLVHFEVAVDKHGVIRVVATTPSEAAQQGTPNEWDDVLHDK